MRTQVEIKNGTLIITGNKIKLTPKAKQIINQIINLGVQDIKLVIK